MGDAFKSIQRIKKRESPKKIFLIAIETKY